MSKIATYKNFGKQLYDATNILHRSSIQYKILPIERQHAKI